MTDHSLPGSTRASERAGAWGWLATGLAISYPTLLTAVYFVALAEWPAVWQQSVYAIGKLIQFGLPLAWAFLIRRERWTWFRPTSRGLVLGTLFGGAVAVAMLLIYQGLLSSSSLAPALADAIQRKLSGFQIAHAAQFAALAAFYCIAHSGLEEYYWRWFAFRSCQTHMPLPQAVLVSSLGFMSHHVLLLGVYFGWTSPLTWLFSLGVAIGGAFWAWLYHRSGRLTGPWFSHFLIDAAIFLIGYDLIRDWLVSTTAR